MPQAFRVRSTVFVALGKGAGSTLRGRLLHTLVKYRLGSSANIEGRLV